MELFNRDRLLFMLLGFAAHDGPLVAYHLACRALRSSGWCSQYLIQSRAPPPELMSKAIRQIAFGHIVLQLPLLWFAYDLFEWAGMPQLNAPWPSMWTIALQFCFFMVVCDTALYWAHRSLHHRLLYATFHKQHHDFKSNDALASEYFSPVEELLTGLIPTLAGPLLLRAHTGVALAWVAFRVCESADAHCGYDFPWSPFRLGRPGDRHDFHHSHNVGNFGAFFSFWDAVCGTDAAYRRHKAEEGAALRRTAVSTAAPAVAATTAAAAAAKVH